LHFLSLNAVFLHVRFPTFHATGRHKPGLFAHMWHGQGANNFPLDQDRLWGHIDLGGLHVPYNGLGLHIHRPPTHNTHGGAWLHGVIYAAAQAKPNGQQPGSPDEMATIRFRHWMHIFLPVCHGGASLNATLAVVVNVVQSQAPIW
jgi:hypothetical protein